MVVNVLAIQSAEQRYREISVATDTQEDFTALVAALRLLRNDRADVDTTDQFL